MIQAGDRSARGSHLRARLQSRAILVRDEAIVGSPDLARIGLVGLALAVQTAVLMSPGHFRPAGQWYFAVAVAAGTLLSLALSVAVTLPIRRVFSLRARRWLAIAALVTLAVLSVMGAWQAALRVPSMVTATPYTNDGAVMDLYAAKQVKHGHNPYLKANIVAALAAIDAPSTTTTPLMDGQFRGVRTYPSSAQVQQVFMNVLLHRPHTIPPEFESKYNYPAGSFLFILPFVWAGLQDMRFLYAIAVILMGAYLWFHMPRSLRFLVPLVVLGNVPLVVLTAGGQPDPIYGLFLMVGYAEWASPWVSPLSMGLAAATKQIAWFFLPFYLVLVARELGWREALRRSAIMGVIFAVLNGPFIIQSPGAYLSSIAGPMADPMFPLGIGIVAVFVSGFLPLAPKLAFTVMELAAWAGGMGAFVRYRLIGPASVAALAALPLFFAWRSLVNYFYLVPLLALAFVLAEPAQRTAARRRRVRAESSAA